MEPTGTICARAEQKLRCELIPGACLPALCKKN